MLRRIKWKLRIWRKIEPGVPGLATYTALQRREFIRTVIPIITLLVATISLIVSLISVMLLT